jgi:4-hydroxy-3-polyprenylbenzoate decarboxylase
MIHYLDEYLKFLRQNDELITINRFVDPNQEIAEITDRQASLPHGGKALLFENNGTSFPVVTNIFNSHKRIALAFGLDTIDDVTTRISAFYEAISHYPAGGRFMRKSPVSELAHYIPRTTTAGSCQEIALFPPDLNRIPFLRNRPFDEAHSLYDVPFIIKNPYQNSYIIESARIQWHSKTTIQIRLEPGSHTAGFIHDSPKGRIPLALFLGGDPLYTLTGIIPQSSDIDPLLLTGYLRKKAIIKAPCISQPLEVPEESDLVIEGYIDKNAQTVPVASCGEHTGFYSIGGKEPLMHVTCITHRKRPLLPLSIPSLGLNRSMYFFTKALSVFMEAKIEQSLATEVRKLCFPFFSNQGSAAIIALRKFYPGQVHKVAHAIWGSNLTPYNKLLIVVDEHVNIFDQHQINDCLRKHYNPSRDTFFSRGPLSFTDHASPQRGFGGKMCIDATDKSVPLSKTSVRSDNPCQFYHKSEADPLLSHPQARILIAVDEEINLKNRQMCYWVAINQADPIRDVRIENGILYVDACIKKKGDRGVTRPWPNVCCSSTETIRKVDSYWERLKIGGPVRSPSLAIQPLLRPGNAQISE